MQHSLICVCRTRPRSGRAVTYLVATLVVVLCVGVGAWFWYQNRSGSDAVQPLTTKVVQSTFEHSVVEQGEVESSVNVEIKSLVKSRNTSGMQLLWVIPEGTVVEAETVVVKLDASALEQERDTQKIACNTTLALKVQAENLHGAAQIARTEYLEGTFQQEKQTIQSEIFLAEENLRRAENYLKYSKTLAFKNFITSQQYEADRFAVEKAKSDLALAKRKLFVLENYTKEKTMRTLESDLATAKAKWDSETERYNLELKKLEEIEQQIALCTIKAPQEGQVVYANVPNPRGGSAEFIVEPGAMVREGQTILRMPDTKNMQVRAKINETRITDVHEGQAVSIKIDALGDEPLMGRVKRVSRFAEPGGWMSSSVKQYATEITILNAPPNIRTGLTAEVNIQIEKTPSALQVPVQSVVEHGGKTYVLAQQGNDWKPLEVQIGSTNDSFVKVDGGLTANQIVAANPRAHLDLFPFVKDGVIETPAALSALSPGEQLASTDKPAGAGALEGATGAAVGTADNGERKKKGGRGRGGVNPGEVFARMDSDGDGKLSAAEWEALPPQYRDGLGNADANSDGSVDQGELSAAFAKLRAAGGGGGERPVEGPGGE